MQSPDTLYQHAVAAYHHAYAPYSNFSVGACIETSRGTLFTGCNVENASYGLTICAEATAITSMVAAGEQTIQQIAIVVTGPGVSSPCGACRQRIFEFATIDTSVHLFDLHGAHKTYTVGELLPAGFGPRDLTIQHNLRKTPAKPDAT